MLALAKASPRAKKAASASGHLDRGLGAEVPALVDQAHEGLRHHREPGDKRQRDEDHLPHPQRHRLPEAGLVVLRGEARERREQHRPDGHREDPLGELVEAEGVADLGGRAVAHELREPGADEGVEVEDAERDGDRHHQEDDPQKQRVSQAEARPDPAPRVAHGTGEEDDLEDRTQEHAPGDGVHAQRALEDHEGDDRQVPDDRDDGRHREPLQRIEHTADGAGQGEEEDGRHEDAEELRRKPGPRGRRRKLRVEDSRERPRGEGQQRHRRAHHDDDQAEQVGRETVGALALALGEQRREHGHEGGADGGVGEELPHEVAAPPTRTRTCCSRG